MTKTKLIIITKGSALTCRRTGRRFPVELALNFSLGDYKGSGRILDMSSTGVSFLTADLPLLIGERIDLSIDWPARLAGGVRLRLIVDGVVVRTAGNLVAVRIGRPQFKTRRGR
jgi:PilZ domain-containing protein